MNPSRKTILVLGGSGHYGRAIVSGLQAHGAKVRVLSRYPGKARQILGDQVEIVPGDIATADSVKTAIAGTDGMVVAVSAFSPQQIRRLKQIEQDAVIAAFDMAVAVGIRRVVYISVFEANREIAKNLRLGNAATLKATVEEYLGNSSLNWTVLGAPPSMDIFFAMIRGETMMVPGGGPEALPTVSPRDVGEIASQSVLRDDLNGQRFKMVGPEAFSFPEAARRISAVWGRPIRFRKIPLAFPRIVFALTGPLAPISRRLAYVHELLRFVRLLNEFPPSIAAETPVLHRRLMSTFSYTPTTLEMEAARRR